jgi:hypothetical protein
MAISSTGSFPQKPKNYKVQILPADASGLKTVATGSADGTKIVAIMVASTDTAARDVQFGITTGGVFFILGTVTIPITAGFVTGVPAVNLLDLTKTPGLPRDNDGNTFILLSSASDTLQVKALTTVTAAKEIDVTAIGADWS